MPVTKDTPPSLNRAGDNRYKARCCGVCAKTGVRLYRGYGEFLYPDRIRCNACLPTNYPDSYVPLVADFYGYIETYHGVEPEVLQVFLVQPEASTENNCPTWVVNGDKAGWELVGVFLGSVTCKGAARDFDCLT
ncbi:MAG TPA: hypothetical protein PLL06_08480 [Acidobacteriota bacterium]|nr:hypothetical protein [Acidobacteriota bacterium]HNG93158.1 hypothetical protein [Acidobacteriota bacterium]